MPTFIAIYTLSGVAYIFQTHFRPYRDKIRYKKQFFTTLSDVNFSLFSFFLCINKRIKAKERYSRTPRKVIVPTLKKFRNPFKKFRNQLKNQKPLKIKNHKKIRNHKKSRTIKNQEPFKRKSRTL